jgi:signal peptidase I
MSVLPALAIFLGGRQLLAEAYRIPSGSMEPTLLVGDRLFVNKLRFGPHIPFTNHSLPGYAAPQRGDVVVFTSPPQDPSIRIAPDDVTPTLVKRIVGVGGDTLRYVFSD